ncbi:MAG: M20/M25/M40 family metallo-hydrolase [Planctomycetes bacterium]|nr:M20/M25/M40 family metallo-hydrolase [Planctomycetota bacterium]
MQPDVIQLARDVVSIQSVSLKTNAEVSDFLDQALKRSGFEVERLEAVDPNGERKVSLVASRGAGPGGLAFISHSDTVPGTGWDRDPWSPAIEGDRLIGLGSCDMKGPLAATVVAAAATDPAVLKKAVLVLIVADEEISGLGARQVVRESQLFRALRPKHGVIAEPTRLIPVYSHKGSARVIVTAHGRAAHTSTDLGVSANFLIAPFLAEVAELAGVLRTDASFMNREFDPPTNGFNMVLDDGGCRPNITAAKTVCTIGFRPMPNAQNQEVIDRVSASARKYGLEVSSSFEPAFYISPQAEVVQAALKAAARPRAETVPFGTDAYYFQRALELVILGPGNIAQAHTSGEWIDVRQLTQAVSVYRRMIEFLCQ